jgi:hypothetical protein
MISQNLKIQKLIDTSSELGYYSPATDCTEFITAWSKVDVVSGYADSHTAGPIWLRGHEDELYLTEYDFPG